MINVTGPVLTPAGWGLLRLPLKKAATGPIGLRLVQRPGWRFAADILRCQKCRRRFLPCQQSDKSGDVQEVNDTVLIGVCFELESVL